MALPKMIHLTIIDFLPLVQLSHLPFHMIFQRISMLIRTWRLPPNWEASSMVLTPSLCCQSESFSTSICFLFTSFDICRRFAKDKVWNLMDRHGNECVWISRGQGGNNWVTARYQVLPNDQGCRYYCAIDKNIERVAKNVQGRWSSFIQVQARTHWRKESVPLEIKILIVLLEVN